MNLTKKNQIRLEFPMVDWLTLTTFDETIAQHWRSTQTLLNLGEYVPTIRRTKALQYDGEQFYTENGSFFLGHGIQKGRDHWMIRISGELSNDYVKKATKHCQDGLMRCSRIDLQMTIIEPETWNQESFLKRMLAAGRKVGWVESSDRVHGRMATVYVGSRESQRFARIYNKGSHDGHKLLRMEFEFKSPLAQGMLRALSGGLQAGTDILKSEMYRLGDGKLNDSYDHLLDGVPRHITVSRETSDERTKKWLLTSVLPSFTRIINNHDDDGRVVRAFQDAIASVDNSH